MRGFDSPTLALSPAWLPACRANHLCETVEQTGVPRLLSGFDITFPDGKHTPASSLKFSLLSSVTFDVALDLDSPEIGARSRELRGLTAVTVPKAAVHEHGGAPLREYQIWASR